VLEKKISFIRTHLYKCATLLEPVTCSNVFVLTELEYDFIVRGKYLVLRLFRSPLHLKNPVIKMERSWRYVINTDDALATNWKGLEDETLAVRILRRNSGSLNAWGTRRMTALETPSTSCM